jgi:hypothetical protein
MIAHTLDSERSILHIRLQSSLEQADFEAARQWIARPA